MRMDYKQYKKLPKDLKDEYDYKFNYEEEINVFNNIPTLLFGGLGLTFLTTNTLLLLETPGKEVLEFIYQCTTLIMIMGLVFLLINLIGLLIQNHTYNKWKKEKVLPRITIKEKK